MSPDFSLQITTWPILGRGAGTLPLKMRSANNNMLEVKRNRTKAGDCSLAVAAASLWNNLPTVIKTCDNLTSFKRLLKTNLFVLHISVIRHEHYYFLLDYLVILSIHTVHLFIGITVT